MTIRTATILLLCLVTCDAEPEVYVEQPSTLSPPSLGEVEIVSMPEPAIAAPDPDIVRSVAEESARQELSARESVVEDWAPDPADEEPLQHMTNAELQAGCDGGKYRFCGRLARRYRTGKGAKQDLAAARSLFDRACEIGIDRIGSECNQLGVMFYNGEGGPRDYRRADVAFTTACILGVGSACSTLGQMAARGLFADGKPDLNYAVNMFETACEHGWKPACRLSKQTAKRVQREKGRER